MKPTDILQKEHRIIECVLDCLEQMARQIEKGERLDHGAARDMIGFFRDFADRFHHAKEEDLLFPSLEARGMPREGGPTGVMLMEHEIGRKLVKAMDDSVTADLEGASNGAANFVKAARDYTALLREHIQKEDHCLFAMANANLEAEEQMRLSKAFRATEKTLAAGKTADYYPQKARELSAKFGVQFPEEDKAPVSSCGCHGSGTCRGS